MATSLREVTVLLVLFSIAMTAGAGMIGSMNLNYNTAIDASYNTTYDKINEMNEKTAAAQSAFENSGLSLSGAGMMLTGGWNIILGLFSSVGIVSSTIREVGAQTGLAAHASYFLVGLVTIAIITIVMSIIGSTFFGKDEV